MLQQVFQTALTDVFSTQYDALGAIRIENSKVYKYVKFSGTTTVAAGDVMCYVVSDTSLQTVDGANSAVGAGMAMAAVASGTVQYGWIQIEGVATLNQGIGGTSPAAGNQVTTTSASAGTVTKAAAVTDQIVGVVVVVASKIVDLQFPY